MTYKLDDFEDGETLQPILFSQCCGYNPHSGSAVYIARHTKTHKWAECIRCGLPPVDGTTGKYLEPKPRNPTDKTKS